MALHGWIFMYSFFLSIINGEFRYIPLRPQLYSFFIYLKLVKEQTSNPEIK